MGNVGAQRAFRAVRTTPHHSIYRSRHRRLLTAFLTALGHNSDNLSSIITTGRSVVLRSMLSPLYTPITLARRPAATESLCYYITPLHIVHVVALCRGTQLLFLHSESSFPTSSLSTLLPTPAIFLRIQIVYLLVPLVSFLSLLCLFFALLLKDVLRLKPLCGTLLRRQAGAASIFAHGLWFIQGAL